MGKNTADMIYMIFGAIMFAAAVSLLVAFTHMTARSTTVVAESIAEKQSIHTKGNTDIDTLVSHKVPLTYTAEQVYDSIIAVDEETTEVFIGSLSIAADKIKAAKSGDERALKDIRDMITGSSYTLKTIFDTDDSKGDHPSKMEFKVV